MFCVKKSWLPFATILLTLAIWPAFSQSTQPDQPVSQPTTQPDQPAKIKFVNVNGASPGRHASVTIQTAPGAKCSIEYITPSGRRSTAAGLTDQVADADGKITWTWLIGARTKPGTGKVIVTGEGTSSSTDITIAEEQ